MRYPFWFFANSLSDVRHHLLSGRQRFALRQHLAALVVASHQILENQLDGDLVDHLHVFGVSVVQGLLNRLQKRLFDFLVVENKKRNENIQN